MSLNTKSIEASFTNAIAVSKIIWNYNWKGAFFSTVICSHCNKENDTTFFVYNPFASKRYSTGCLMTELCETCLKEITPKIDTLKALREELIEMFPTFKVMRTSGAIEDDWTFDGFFFFQEKPCIRVAKGEITKEILVDDFVKWNS